MTQYEKMTAAVRSTYAARIACMVKGGKSAEEAKAILKAKNQRRFNAASVRAKCGITSKPSTIGEILAAKAR